MARDNNFAGSKIKDTRSFKATPVDNYRRKIGHHDKQVVQKDIKHQRSVTERHRNFGQSLRDSWKIILTVLGVVTAASLAIYGVLLIRVPSKMI